MVGSKHAHILTSTVVEDWDACTLRGQTVIDLFPRIYDAIEATLGNEGASLLALPEQSYSKTRQAKVVTWYTDRTGSFRPLDALSDEERAKAEDLLRRNLADVIDQGDAEVRELLSVAFNMPSADGVFFNGETIVLANWGFVRKDEAAGEPVVGALSPYLPASFLLAQHVQDETTNAEEDDYPDDPAPENRLTNPSVAAVPAAGSVGRSAAAGARAQAAGPAGHAVADAHAASVSQAQAASSGWRGATAWLSGVALLLVLFLIYLLWPGSLLYPSRDLGPLGQDQASEAQRHNQDAIRGQIGRLQGALAGNVCTAADAEALDGIAGLPVLPEIGRRDAVTPNAGQQPTAPAAGQPDAPAAPSASTPSPQSGEAAPTGNPAAASSTALDSHELIEKLDNGSVLVVSIKADGTDLGSGFFITPQRVLTNYHVVEGNDTGNILIANRHLPSPVPARVIARSASSQTSSQDFALLELERPVDLTPLPLSTAVDRLDGVIAAGFPRAVIDGDPNFATAMREGRADSLNRVQMAVTRGEVTTLQPGQNGTTVVVHSATISFGNSGGPLVDRCGRVVGINTYLRTNAVDTSMRLNAALSTKDIIQFLQANGAATEATSNRCTESARSAAPSQPAAGQPIAGQPATILPAPAATPQPVATDPAPVPTQALPDAPVAPPASGAQAQPPAVTSTTQAAPSTPTPPSAAPDPSPPQNTPQATPAAPAEPANEADALVGPSNGASR